MKSAGGLKAEYYSKEVLKYLLVAGAVTVAASSPYFLFNLMRAQISHGLQRNRNPRKEKSSFTYLRKKGFIETTRIGQDIKIALTTEGKKRAGKYQIDDLVISRPKKWDSKWRVVIFDISTESNFVRNVFRRKLKEFGFQPLQMSVWVYPFPCTEEIDLIRQFLGADKHQIRVMEVTKMEGDRSLRAQFGV